MITLTHEEAEQVIKLLDTFDTFNDFTDVREPLRAKLSEPEPEPVAWISTSPARMIHWKSDKPVYDDDWIPLYTAPPQREWQGLTVDEFYDLDDVGRKMILEYGRLVEAKLREKNT